ncbi:MAG: hypothetical protein BWY15_02218 [Firmicutes bacterium ADurb.Bin193]|nr:MAG: hypothetical protein BWY15_02218 [Firmicutes bacterium ADurb.Bin193]
MGEREELIRIRSALEKSVGQKVRLTAKKGRKKAVVRHGVIEETFPSIFTVKLDNTIEQLPSSSRRVSYSYTDILTKVIEIAKC